MSIESLEQKSLIDLSAELKTKNTTTSYLNFDINIALLGEEVFGQKRPKNIFDINGVSKKERYFKSIQEKYLLNLLKASTPNFKIDNKIFNFNTKERVGWIVLEFEVYKRLSATQNIKYINEFIYNKVGVQPTFISVEDETVYVGLFFPNAPTTKDEDRLKKYTFFKFVRQALTHVLDGNWEIEAVDNYNEVKEYKNIYKSTYKIFGNIFEIGVFNKVLDNYQNSDLCKEIILKKQAYAGKKSGVTKRAKPTEERNLLTLAARKKRMDTSKDKLRKTLLHILHTHENPEYSRKNIIQTSRELKKGLAGKTIKKYLKEIKSDLNIE